MKKYILALAALSFAFSTVSHAQERSAGGTMDTQVTWTALSNLAKAASDKATAVNSRVDQSVICGRNNKLYTPGKPGADTQGCTSIDFSSLDSRFNNIETNVANINNCAKNGMFYSTATGTCRPVPPFDVQKLEIENESFNWVQDTRALGKVVCGTGADVCAADNATLKRVCKLHGYTSVSGYSRKTFSSPKNNTIGRWTGSKFLVFNANMDNEWIEAITCMRFTYE